jgi:hypothetical protein
MSFSHHPCIDANECESFGDFCHHPVEERTNTIKGMIKKPCQVAISKGSNVN